MLVAGILALSVFALLLGARFYAPIIGRVLGERPERPTPAVTLNDGRDYVPTRTPVVFAHHFASIAGAGPIVGPVLAIYYGWGPALIWILLGGIFMGAVHDYVSTHIAMREGGRNLTVVARRYVGQAAFVLLLILLVLLLALVCAAFLDLSATALTSMVPLSVLELSPDQSLFRVQGDQAVIGGIASTSVIIITACSPFIGFLYLKKKTPVWICSLLAMLICGLSIWLGLLFPVTVSPFVWKLLIAGYVLIAAGLPVWLFLQSRDFINVHLLYAGMLFLTVALIAAAVRGGGKVELAGGIPFTNWSDASARLGPGWPVLFVTIACGAVSGFHSLCAGGTTCKQLCNEMGARRVGYYAMLLESFLAACVVCCLMVGLSLTRYQGYCYPAEGKGNAVLTFAMGVGQTVNIGLGLPIAAGALGAMLLLEGFLVTTLDTAVRLTRYMIEEGWANLFARYDVFAADAAIEADRARQVPAESGGATVLVGTGGLTPEAPTLLGTPTRGVVVQTSGLQRLLLKGLRYYWVNSAIAVALMLLLGMGSGYQRLWPIFGSGNQLLAAMALLVGTCWLASRARPLWYTIVPAIFMLVTSVTMLVREFSREIRQVLAQPSLWPEKGMLLATEGIVLAATLGIAALAVARLLRLRNGRLAEVRQATI
jgi:carbon starvation protein